MITIHDDTGGLATVQLPADLTHALEMIREYQEHSREFQIAPNGLSMDVWGYEGKVPANAVHTTHHISS